MTNTILQVRSAADAIAAVVYGYGYRPVESVTVAAVRGAESGVSTIVDIEAFSSFTAARLATIMDRDEATSVFVVAWTTSAQRAREVVETMTEALHGLAIDVTAFAVDGESYRSMNDMDGEARPMSEVYASPVALTLATATGALASSRAEMLPAPAPEEARRAALAWMNTALATGAGLTAWRAAVVAQQITPEHAGTVAVAISKTLVRDAIIVSLIPGVSPEIPERIATSVGVVDGPEGDALRKMFDTSNPARPGEAAQAGVRLLNAVVAHVPESVQAWATLALIYWWMGSGILARDAAQRARHINPSHRLATLVTKSLDTGIAPAWARR